MKINHGRFTVVNNGIFILQDLFYEGVPGPGHIVKL